MFTYFFHHPYSVNPTPSFSDMDIYLISFSFIPRPFLICQALFEKILKMNTKSSEIARQWLAYLIYPCVEDPASFSATPQTCGRPTALPRGYLPLPPPPGGHTLPQGPGPAVLLVSGYQAQLPASRACEEARRNTYSLPRQLGILLTPIIGIYISNKA